MSENEVMIEQARSADIPAMVGLLAALFNIEQDFKPDTERQIRGLAGVLASPNACIMLARTAQGEAIAMCSAQLVFSTAEGAHSAWIEDMVVHEAWRGRGIGRQVLQAVLAWASERGATRAQLLADLDNQPALDYYQHLGWQETQLIARRLSLQRRAPNADG
ncbi:MAG: GNAT family N-acetyltransferase [Oxalobacteraceae bacterium]|jgi:ribosomal protein S18 acetylase RimI-like enzyme|nr:GNAT family N-acetyltransferase [Oxalobacteraceae bacterium]